MQVHPTTEVEEYLLPPDIIPTRAPMDKNSNQVMAHDNAAREASLKLPWAIHDIEEGPSDASRPIAVSKGASTEQKSALTDDREDKVMAQDQAAQVTNMQLPRAFLHAPADPPNQSLPLLPVGNQKPSPHHASSRKHQKQKTADNQVNREPVHFWLAAVSGNYKEVAEIIAACKDEAEVTQVINWTPSANWTPADGKSFPLQYKGRPIYGQAIHAVAAHRPSDPDDDPRGPLMRLLLAHRADPAAKAYTTGGSREAQPIHIAAGTGNLEGVALLLEAGAKVNAMSRCLEGTALKDMAVNLQKTEGDFLQAAQLLDPAHGFEDHYAPIHDAVWFGRDAVVEQLLKHGGADEEDVCDVDRPNNMHCTALHLAAGLNQVEITELLLNSKADHSKLDGERCTPLIVALTKGKREIVGKLLPYATQSGDLSPDLLSAIIRKEGPGWADALDSIFVNPDNLFAEWVTAGETLKVDFWDWPGEARLQREKPFFAVPIDVPKSRDDFMRLKGKQRIISILGACQSSSCPQVRSCVSVFPSTLSTEKHSISNLTDDAVIRAVVQTGNQDMMTTAVVQAVVDLSFKDPAQGWYRKWNIFLSLACIAAVMVASSSLFTQSNVAYCVVLIVLYFATSLRTLDEAWQFVEQRLSKEPISISCFSDWPGIALGLVGVIYLSISNVDVTGQGFIAAFVFQRYLIFLGCLMGLPQLGPRVLPIFYAVMDTAEFAAVLFIFFVGAVNVYWFIGPQDVATYSYSPLYSTIFRIYNFAILNSFDINALIGPDGAASSNNTLIFIFFFAVNLSTYLVLMQLLIGILGSNYSNYIAERDTLFLRHQAQMVLDTRQKPVFRFFSFIMRRIHGKQVDDHRHLFTVKIGDDSGQSAGGQMTESEQQTASFSKLLSEMEDRLKDYVKESMEQMSKRQTDAS